MPDGLAVWRVLRGAGVKLVKFVVVDIFGRPRAEVLPIEAAREAFLDGVAYDGSSIPAYTTVNKSDLVALPDLNAVYVESWNGGKTAIVFTNTVDGGKPHPMDPRNVLRQAADYAKSRGYAPVVGAEVEFFLVRGVPPAPADSGVYFDGYLHGDSYSAVEEILGHLEASGIGLSKTHHEVAPGQYEVNIPAGDPVQVADQILVFKIMAKAVAKRRGLTATFMPKPFWGVNGSGMHVHVSFWKDGVNLFASRGEPTQELKWAVAGVLENALRNSAFVAPTVNSYKRLVPHHEAPTRVVWGLGNRSVMVRIPYYGGRINRLEYRHPDPSANPYLAFAVIILSALEGIEKKREPPPPVAEVAYELEEARETPPNLGEALKMARDGTPLPGQFLEAYLRLKEREWEEYITAEGSWETTWNKITKWEYEKYLEEA